MLFQLGFVEHGWLGSPRPMDKENINGQHKIHITYGFSIRGRTKPAKRWTDFGRYVVLANDKDLEGGGTGLLAKGLGRPFWL